MVGVRVAGEGTARSGGEGGAEADGAPTPGRAALAGSLAIPSLPLLTSPPSPVHSSPLILSIFLLPTFHLSFRAPPPPAPRHPSSLSTPAPCLLVFTYLSSWLQFLGVAAPSPRLVSLSLSARSPLRSLPRPQPPISQSPPPPTRAPSLLPSTCHLVLLWPD